MNEVTEYGLMVGLAVCGLTFLGCALTTLVLIPFAFGQGFRAFAVTKDLRDIVAARGESPWVWQVYTMLRRVQHFAAVGMIGFGVGVIVWMAIPMR